MTEEELEIKQILLNICQKQKYNDIKKTIFMKGISREYVQDTYDRFKDFLTENDKKILMQYTDITLVEKQNQDNQEI